MGAFSVSLAGISHQQHFSQAAIAIGLIVPDVAVILLGRSGLGRRGGVA